MSIAVVYDDIVVFFLLHKTHAHTPHNPRSDPSGTHAYIHTTSNPRIQHIDRHYLQRTSLGEIRPSLNPGHNSLTTPIEAAYSPVGTFPLNEGGVYGHEDKVEAEGEFSPL